ncbi:hypothetical protein ACFE04_002225 [Oxalis oulophora]
MSTGLIASLPPALDSKSEQPPLFDGTTRLYTSYTCPFAQRVWITRNFKGLQDQIKLVGLNLQDRPAWYHENVYPANKVPALEHDGKIVGESLDLIKYLDQNFAGPKLFPDDEAKKQFGEELLAYTDTFFMTVFKSAKGDVTKEAAPAFDYLENALNRFDDGPFLLGQFSLADIAYIPFVERFQIFLTEVFKYDITAGRPKFAVWIEEMNKIDAYTSTKVVNPTDLVEYYKKRMTAALTTCFDIRDNVIPDSQMSRSVMPCDLTTPHLALHPQNSRLKNFTFHLTRPPNLNMMDRLGLKQIKKDDRSFHEGILMEKN